MKKNKKFILVVIIILILLVFSMAYYIWIQKKRNYELVNTITHHTLKINNYERYDNNDTLQIIKIILNKLEFNDQTKNKFFLRVMTYPYLSQNLDDFKIDSIEVCFNNVSGFSGDLPENMIQFTSFKLNPDSTGIIELIYGNKKIFILIVKNDNWEIKRFEIAD